MSSWNRLPWLPIWQVSHRESGWAIQRFSLHCQHHENGCDRSMKVWFMQIDVHRQRREAKKRGFIGWWDLGIVNLVKRKPLRSLVQIQAALRIVSLPRFPPHPSWALAVLVSSWSLYPPGIDIWLAISLVAAVNHHCHCHNAAAWTKASVTNLCERYEKRSMSKCALNVCVCVSYWMVLFSFLQFQKANTTLQGHHNRLCRCLGRVARILGIPSCPICFEEIGVRFYKWKKWKKMARYRDGKAIGFVRQWSYRLFRAIGCQIHNHIGGFFNVIIIICRTGHVFCFGEKRWKKERGSKMLRLGAKRTESQQKHAFCTSTLKSWSLGDSFKRILFVELVYM